MDEITLQENSKFYLNEDSKRFLKETAKWAYFLSILGFVGVGFMLVLAVFIGTIFSKLDSMGGDTAMLQRMGGGFISFIYVVIAALYFFPVYYLFQFSSKMKAAFKNEDNDALNESFSFLKSHYKFMGVLALVFVILYGIIFLFTILIGGIAFLS
ncbi:DUF5362 family protein [Flavobacterium degerlachei]|jgi:uncharacterized membrane protein|uniref:DUF5362 domain-containing protein n=1 Tax=Flavobacterium degerlachei TaxID=229203 RepID=A0A1H3FNK6_9FLAO|nr:DUF5362 family protein [Flavobacterium degerlachei]SDX91978.1 hypothetical protein SAMN05444338_11848 [Flavobacterium degerlachei]